MKSVFLRVLCLALVIVMTLCLTFCDDNSTDRTEGSTSNSNIDGTLGNQLGDVCFGADLETFSGESFNITDTRGKVTVINFWGEWCPWCLYELPDFDKVASEYEENVSIVAVHSVSGLEDGLVYAAENFPNTKMIFVKDDNREGQTYYSLLGGTGSYPRTIVLDRNGKIVFSQYGAMSYDALVAVIEDYI